MLNPKSLNDRCFLSSKDFEGSLILNLISRPQKPILNLFLGVLKAGIIGSSVPFLFSSL